MAERSYTLQDVKDYLYEKYELDWKDFKVLDSGVGRRPRASDFGENGLMICAVLYKEGRKDWPRVVFVNDEFISVSGLGRDYYDWREFLAQRHNQEQNLIR